VKRTRAALSLIAAIVFVAALIGLFRSEVSWFVWGLIYGNPVKWGNYSVPISPDVFVASLPNDRLLVIGSKHKSGAALRVSIVPGANVQAPAQCANVSPNCRITQESTGGARIIQIACESESSPLREIAEHYCVEGTPIRMTYSGPAQARHAFDASIRALLTQTAMQRNRN
jgi:hypothetical protein